MNRQSYIPAFAALTLIATTSVLSAGPLNPPAGAVTSTAKPLSEVEPRTAINSTNTPGDANSVYRITAAGSYYLTGNVLGGVGKRGIEVAASHVTIDLCGFTVDGQGAGSLDGIATEGLAVALVVRNGHLINWGGSGLSASAGGALAGNRLEHIVARGNLANGISAGDNAAVIACTAISNGGTGIAVSSGATVVSCVARGNTGVGINAGTGCAIEDCAARANGSTGIIVGTSSAARGCAAHNNETGIFIGSGAVAQGCAASENDLAGFQTSTSAMVIDSNADWNLGSGFALGAGSTVERCRSSNNAVHGFTVSNFAVVRHNHAYANGTGGVGAGFHCTGSDSRIEGNVNRGSDYGFWVLGARNILTGNTTAGAITPFDLAANNLFGAIVDRSAAATAAFSGGAAAGNLTTTDPHANITH